MKPSAPCCLLCALLVVTACSAPGKGVIALEGATLIDGAGGPPKADALILIQNGRIQAVARVNEIAIPRGAERIDLVGKTIIPGLIDAHAHVERWAVPRYLAWGVTTVRDLHSPGDSGYTLKNDLNLGAIVGPRMFTAGPMIDGVPATYPGATAVAGAEEARQAVDQRAVAGADYIKIYTKITPDLLQAIAQEALTLHLRVAAHLGKIDAVTAAKLGVVSIEHMSGVVQATVRDPEPYFRAHDLFLPGWTHEEAGWGSLDSAALERTARALAATHVAIVPTLVVHDVLSRLNDTTLLRRPEMADVPADTANVVRRVNSLLQRSGWRAPDFAAFRRARVKQDLFLRAFRRSGGLVAAGSDAANQLLIPGEALHEEMALLVGAGMTPLDAIATATRRGAELLRADSLGMIVPGRVADLVVLTANPAQDIAHTKDIAWVMIRGHIVKPDSLRAEWRK